MRRLSKLIAGAAIAVTATAMAAAPALADPINSSGGAVTPKQSDVVGAGSDTTEYIVDQLSFDYNKANSKGARLYSWDALNPKTGLTDNIKLKTTCPVISRPDGSSAGIAALIVNTHSKDGTHYCQDFARSSRGRKSTDPAKGAGGILFVALAKDAVAFASNSTTNAPPNLTTAQLHAIYTCTDTTWNQVGGSSSATIDPQLPQIGSGTRAFFETAIGITDATVGACVGQTAEENEGTNPVFTGANAANVIEPYSIGKYIAERYHSQKCLNTGCTPVGGVICKPTGTKNRFGCDDHGNMQLREINGTKPTTGSGSSTVINPHFSANFVRTVYDVVRYSTSTADHIPSYLEPFFGSKSKHGWICSSSTAQKDLVNYGFLPTPFCGTGS